MKKKFYKKEELVFAEKLKDKRFQDLEGKKFERLTVLGYAGRRGKNLYWNCHCKCGNYTVIGSRHLKSGRTTSCGCFSIKCIKERSTTHGHARRHNKTPTYRTWANMLDRCRNHNNSDFFYYGGRGIKVCDRWKNSFENFLEDMGERPKRTSIDRIDNNGNYEPGNCRWATKKEQNNNQRSNINLTFNGKTQTTAQWADELGMNSGTVRYRVNKLGWSAEKALTTPLRT